MKLMTLLLLVLASFNVWSQTVYIQNPNMVQPVQAPAPAPAPAPSGGGDGDKYSGVPHLVRDYPVPQVFFSDGRTFYIPPGGDYNRIMNALNNSLSKKAPVKVQFDKNSKMITDIDAPKSAGPSSIYDESSAEEDANKKAAPTGGGAAGGVQGGGIAVPAGLPGATPAPKKNGWGGN